MAMGQYSPWIVTYNNQQLHIRCHHSIETGSDSLLKIRPIWIKTMSWYFSEPPTLCRFSMFLHFPQCWVVPVHAVPAVHHHYHWAGGESVSHMLKNSEHQGMQQIAYVHTAISLFIYLPIYLYLSLSIDLSLSTLCTPASMASTKYQTNPTEICQQSRTN